MKKILIIIYLLFSTLSFLADIINDFREVKKSIYSLNFDKNYMYKKLYVKKIISDMGGDSNYGNAVIFGHFGNETKIRNISVSQSVVEKYRNYDNENNVYYNVWYNKNTETIFLKVTETGKIYFNGFLLIMFWVFIIPSIYYLTKRY